MRSASSEHPQLKCNVFYFILGFIFGFISSALLSFFNWRDLDFCNLHALQHNPGLLCILFLWLQQFHCLAPSPQQIGRTADGGYQIPTASHCLFIIHVWCANLLPESQGVLSVKPRLNQISSHVLMIRPYQIVNYPQHGGSDKSDG